MTLSENIKIDDVTSGKIDPQLIYNELDRLKLEINILRSDMSRFLTALVTIPPHQHQSEYYNLIVSRLNTLKSSIADYCVQYNKLLPIINLAQIRLGHEVEVSSAQTAPGNETNPSPEKGKRKANSKLKGSTGSSGQPIVL